MKKHQTFQASSSFLGILLILSLIGTAALTSFDVLADFYAAFKSQWLQFTEQLSMAQPHRIHFPQ